MERIGILLKLTADQGTRAELIAHLTETAALAH